MGKFLWIFMISSAVLGQSQDLAKQFLMIKDMMPESTRFGVIYNPNANGVDEEINIAINQMGLTAIKSPATSVREIPSTIRKLVTQYEVDFIYIVEDRILTGATSLKYAVRQSAKKGIPIFTTAGNAFKSGVYGRFIPAQGDWNLLINSDVTNKYSVPLPNDDPRIRLQ